MTYTRHTSRSLTKRRSSQNNNFGQKPYFKGGFQARPRRKPSSIDVSLLVKKSEAAQVEEVYQSRHTFLDFSFSEKLHQNIVSRGYTTPTPIQDQAISPILEGRDVIGIANTGTGKTAAFLLPLITKVHADPRLTIF